MLPYKFADPLLAEFTLWVPFGSLPNFSFVTVGRGDSGVNDSDFSGKLRLFVCYLEKHFCVVRNDIKKTVTPPRKTLSAVNRFSI